MVACEKLKSEMNNVDVDGEGYSNQSSLYTLVVLTWRTRLSSTRYRNKHKDSSTTHPPTPSTMSTQPALTPTYLRTLPSIRQRSTQVYHLALQSKLSSFDLHEPAYDPIVDYCISVIKRTYPTLTGIPGHSRWRHFETPELGGLVEPLLRRWEVEEGVGERERVRRLVDLFVVSVLLDGEWRERSERASEASGRAGEQSERGDCTPRVNRRELISFNTLHRMLSLTHPRPRPRSTATNTSTYTAIAIDSAYDSSRYTRA